MLFCAMPFPARETAIVIDCHAAEAVPPQGSAAFRLNVVHMGGERPPESYHFSQRELCIGRAETSGLRLWTPLCLVSRHHAALYQVAGRCWVVDNHSRNGTWHNGQPVRAAAATVLADGDELLIGDFQITIHLVHPCAATNEPKNVRSALKHDG